MIDYVEKNALVRIHLEKIVATILLFINLWRHGTYKSYKNILRVIKYTLLQTRLNCAFRLNSLLQFWIARQLKVELVCLLFLIIFKLENL